MTERELFKRAYLESGKVLGEAAKAKIPDGLLIHENGTKDAVEVELTKKTNSRLLQQIKRYREELNLNKYNRVLYFCSRDSIIDSLSYIVHNLNIASKILILKFNKEDKFKGLRLWKTRKSLCRFFNAYGCLVSVGCVSLLLSV